MIADYFNQIKMEKKVIIIEKSTVPVNTAAIIYEILSQNQRQFPTNCEMFSVISNPEFLSEDNYFY